MLRRTALATALFALAAAVAAADSPPVPQAGWQPLEIGTSWTYDYRRDRSQAVGGGRTEIERFRGTLQDRVKGAAVGYDDGVVEIVSTVRGHTEGDAIVSTETRRVFVEPHPAGYRIHALDSENPIHGGRQLVRYEPPLEQLDVQQGTDSKWLIGSIDVGGLKTRLEAKVLGLQPVETPSGRYENCLVVRSEGPLAGSVEAYGGTIEVTGGKVVTTEWYARGLGVVLAKEEAEQTLRLPDGSTLVVRERTQYALREGGPGASQPASR